MSVIKGYEWTFDTVAETYDKMRPGYPSELYNDIFRLVKLTGSSNSIEVGIGGGQATLPILETGCNVTAVEYGKNLTELCLRKFKEYPNFSAVNMKFEDFSCEEQSQDLIYSASAFHWIPEKIGYSKAFDMLKSGGVFARFANHPYKDKSREELHDAIQKLYAIYMPGASAPQEYTLDDAKNRANIASKYGFIGIYYKLYLRTRTFTADEYAELMNTYSDHIVLPDNVKNEFYTKVRKTINDFGGLITIYDTIDLQIAVKP